MTNSCIPNINFIEGGEERLRDLTTNPDPYLRYLGRMSIGIAECAERIGIEGDSCTTFQQATTDVLSQEPQVSEFSTQEDIIEIGVPSTFGDLKTWTAGSITAILATSWKHGADFNRWARLQDPQMPLY